MSKTKLVTGSSGFIGSHYMEHHEGCVPFDVKNEAWQRVSYENIMTVAANNKIDHIVHLAALTSAPESIRYPDVYWGNNVDAMRQMLKAWGGEVTFASSAAVYQPLNPYALTKCVGEHMLLNEFHREGVRIYRFFNVFGERAKGGVVKLFIERALLGKPLLITGYGFATRSFVYVKDLVKIMDTPYHDGIIDIFGYNCTIQWLAEFIIKVTNSKSEIHYLPQREGDPVYGGYDMTDEGNDAGLLRFRKGIDATINNIIYEKLH